MESNGQLNRNVDRWQPCPQGALERTAQRLRNAGVTTQRTGFARVGVGVVVLFVVGAGVVWRLSPSAAGGITCAECQAEFDALHRHVDLGETTLSEEMEAAVLAHLEHCDACSQEFRKLYPESHVWTMLSLTRASLSKQPLAFPTPKRTSDLLAMTR